MMPNFLVRNIRAAAVLTNSYVAATTVDDAYEYNQLVLHCLFTKGSLDSLEIKVEFSNDDTTYYRETNASTTAGTTTLTVNEYTLASTANIEIAIPISTRYIKVSAKGTGTVTSSSLAINAVLATV